MSTVVEVKNLIKRYKELVAVDNFGFSIEEGEVFGLLGPNGSGKSTTINCLLSIMKYDNGSIKIFGEEMGPSRRDIKRRIGVVSQNVAVMEDLNVYDNVDFFCGLYIKDKKKRKEYVDEAIEFVGLEEYKKFRPAKLSGGLLRRLNIACGIAHKPELIIMDEPTVAVDPQSRNKILEGILELNKKGSTIIYTSHYMEEVEQICSRILIMDKGKKIAVGTKDELKRGINNTETITVNVKNIADKVISDIENIHHVYKVKYDGETLKIMCNGGKHNISHVVEYFADNNIGYEGIYSELPTLNDVFLEITGKELRD
ncbi:MAG: ABC transporter ATP-binding protein [Eubacterium sp.]|nr:ABC transporter ATP-binding protein [Eubacterium sp.]